MEIYTMRATIPTRILQRKTYNGPPSFEPRLKLPDCLVSVLMSQPLDFIVIRRSMLRAIRCICNFTTVAFYDLDNSCVYYNARDVSHKNLNYLLKYNFFFYMKNINYYLLWKEKKKMILHSILKISIWNVIKNVWYIEIVINELQEDENCIE